MEPTQELTLADFLRGAGTQARGFGAGLVNPFGAAGWGARGLAHMAPGMIRPETARGFQDTLNRWEEDAPIAATMGSMVVPGYGGARLLAKATPREALQLIPILWSASPLVNNVYDAFSGASNEMRWRDNERRSGP